MRSLSGRENTSGGGAPIRFERYSFPLYCNELLCRVSFRLTGLYCGIIWAERSTFEDIGGFVNIKATEDVQTAKRLKKYGEEHEKRYTVLKNNYGSPPKIVEKRF